MDTQESVITTEVPREFKDMVTDITRDPLPLDIMDMDILNLMSTDTISTRGLLMLSLDMDLLMSM